jgi:hypothetical protein
VNTVLTVLIASTMLVLGAITEGALGPLLSVLGLAPLVGWAVFGASRPPRARVEVESAAPQILRALVVDRV